MINYRKSVEGAEDTEEIALQKACEEAEQCGVKTLLIQGDVSQEEDSQKMLSATVDRFGGFNILINNAGIQKEYPSHEIPTE